MKVSDTKILVLLAAMILLLGTPGMSQYRARSNAIGIRGTYWGGADRLRHQQIRNYGDFGINSQFGGGGWIYFLSRANEYIMFEFGLGAIGVSVDEFSNRWQNNVNVTGTFPVVLGIQHYLIAAGNRSAIHPYLSLGGGPYWIADIKVRETRRGEEVDVATVLKPGGYVGGGLNFMLGSRFGLNFDVKYHMVDFNVNHDRTGVEYGVGIQYMWGRQKHRQRPRYRH